MPASIQFLPPVLRAALEELETNFAAHVAAYNAETANTVDLAAPVAYVFGADGVGAGPYPYVEVAALRGTLGPFAIGEGGNPSEADSDPRVTVVVWLEGSNGEVPELYEAALGYARVVVEILTRKGAFGLDAEVSNEKDAIDWRVDPIPGEIDDVNRTVLRWKMPATVVFHLEALDRWIPA